MYGIGVVFVSEAGHEIFGWHLIRYRCGAVTHFPVSPKGCTPGMSKHVSDAASTAIGIIAQRWGTRDGRYRRGCSISYLGIMTLSMTWMTPLLHSISVFTTFALSTVTPDFPAVILTDLPLTVLAPVSFTTSCASTLPATTW